MLSHDTLYFSAMTGIKILKLREKNEVFISYLPLSHIAGQLQDIWAAIFNMSTIVFADKLTLQDGKLLAETIRETRPTCLFGVPRVWEKIM